MDYTNDFEPDWLNKTLEVLENDIWEYPSFPSYLNRTCYSLRKKPLNDFDTEDLRIMIGNGIGLKYLVPLALEVLQKNILAEGDFYEGDLLKFMLISDKKYWKENVGSWQTVCNLVDENENLLRTFETVEGIREELFEAFRKFEEIHVSPGSKSA